MPPAKKSASRSSAKRGAVRKAAKRQPARKTAKQVTTRKATRRQVTKKAVGGRKIAGAARESPRRAAARQSSARKRSATTTPSKRAVQTRATLGPGQAGRQSRRRRVRAGGTLAERIIDHLATVESAGAQELAKVVKGTRQSVAATLSYLTSQRRIRRVSRGRYARRR